MCKIEDNNKPKYEIQDIFNLYADDYIKSHKITSEQNKAIKDISNCRTSSFGYNARQCNGCGNIQFSYNSCRNRNCPKCQGNKRYDWIQKRLKTTLAVPYYHTVFTVPNHQLFEIALYNQKIFYDLLFKCASDTLKQFAKDLKWWDLKDTNYDEPDIKLSFFGVLHTWGGKV